MPIGWDKTTALKACSEFLKSGLSLDATQPWRWLQGWSSPKVCSVCLWRTFPSQPLTIPRTCAAQSCSYWSKKVWVTKSCLYLLWSQCTWPELSASPTVGKFCSWVSSLWLGLSQEILKVYFFCVCICKRAILVMPKENNWNLHFLILEDTLKLAFMFKIERIFQNNFIFIHGLGRNKLLKAIFVFICVYMHAGQYLQGTEKGVGLPGASVTIGYTLLILGSGNWTQPQYFFKKGIWHTYRQDTNTHKINK